jgi:DNA-binding protein HU-beta
VRPTARWADYAAEALAAWVKERRIRCVSRDSFVLSNPGASPKSAVGLGFVASEPIVRVRGRPYDEEDTLTKSEFVDSIAGDFASKKAAADAVESVLDGIADTLAGGGEVNFTGFGKFSVAERGPRQGVNPRTGERITIAGGRVPKFSAGAGLKSKVKG